jgi:hypothetical protein
LRPEFALSGFYHEFEPVNRRGYVGPGEGNGLHFWPAASDGAEEQLRFVLFLRNEGTDGVGAVWMPVGAPPTQRPVRGYMYSGPGEALDSYLAQRAVIDGLPTDANCDFTSSVALVEGGRVLALQTPPAVMRRSPDETPALMPVAGTLKDFKAEVMRIPAPRRSEEPRPPPEQGRSLRSWADFGTFTPYPPEPSAKGSHP